MKEYPNHPAKSQAQAIPKHTILCASTIRNTMDVESIDLDSKYNRLNLITTTRLRGGMPSINGKNQVLRHVLRHVTQRIVKSWKSAHSREHC